MALGIMTDVGVNRSKSSRYVELVFELMLTELKIYDIFKFVMPEYNR